MSLASKSVHNKFHFLFYLFHFIQEPWPNDKIKTHLIEKFNVKFDLFAKIEVNGSNADPLWNYLKMKQGGTLGE